MKAVVDVAWLLFGDDVESALRKRRDEVERSLQCARAHALVELEEGDALTELVTRALRSMSAPIYPKMMPRRGDIGREQSITYCERALRAFYALDAIGGAR